MNIKYNLLPHRKQIHEAKRNGEIVIGIIPPVFKKYPKMWLYALGITEVFHNLILYHGIDFTEESLDRIKQLHHTNLNLDIAIVSGVYKHLDPLKLD